MHQKIVIFAIIGIFKILVLNMSHISTMVVMKQQVVSIKGSDYRIHSMYISKGDAVNIMTSLDLNEKSGLLYIFFII